MSIRRRRKNILGVREKNRWWREKVLYRMERTAAEPGRKGHLDATYEPFSHEINYRLFSQLPKGLHTGIYTHFKIFDFTIKNYLKIKKKFCFTKNFCRSKKDLCPLGKILKKIQSKYFFGIHKCFFHCNFFNCQR